MSQGLIAERLRDWNRLVGDWQCRGRQSGGAFSYEDTGILVVISLTHLTLCPFLGRAIYKCAFVGVQFMDVFSFPLRAVISIQYGLIPVVEDECSTRPVAEPGLLSVLLVFSLVCALKDRLSWS